MYNSYSTPHRSMPTGEGQLKHTLNTLMHFVATAASLIILIKSVTPTQNAGQDLLAIRPTQFAKQ